MMAKINPLWTIGIILVALFLFFKGGFLGATVNTDLIKFRTSDLTYAMYTSTIAINTKCDGTSLTQYKVGAAVGLPAGKTCNSQYGIPILNEILPGNARSGCSTPSYLYLENQISGDLVACCDRSGTGAGMLYSKTANTESSISTDFTKEIKCERICTPNWQCTEWSSCSNGQQTRTCADSSNCGVSNKPITSQSCQVMCTQEAGQLCDPINKHIASYSNGCEKNDLIQNGHQSDLSLCQQSCVTNPQLLIYISDWVNNQITNQQLLNYISSWVNC